MSMTRIFTYAGFVLALVSMSVLAKAQQDPYYTHFKFNKQAYNPGAVGTTDDVICVSGITHSQWRNYDDLTFIDRKTGEPVSGGEIVENVAPVTYNFNIGGQITTNKGQRQLGAVGATVYSDKLGFQKTTSFRLQGAYFIPVQGNFGRLAIGIEAGFNQFGYDNPRFRALNPNDPRIPLGSANDSKLDLGFGVYYKQRRLGNSIENFYAGLSASHLNQAKFEIPTSQANATITHQMEMHYYFVTGADIDLSPGLVLEPAIWIKSKAKPQIDVNATVLYNDMIRGGLGYRQWGNTDALSIMVGYKKDMNNSNVLQIGYSYDVTMSQIRTVSDGTHEIMVTYCFPLAVSKKPPTKKFHRNTRWL